MTRQLACFTLALTQLASPAWACGLNTAPGSVNFAAVPLKFPGPLSSLNSLGLKLTTGETGWKLIDSDGGALYFKNTAGSPQPCLAVEQNGAPVEYCGAQALKKLVPKDHQLTLSGKDGAKAGVIEIGNDGAILIYPYNANREVSRANYIRLTDATKNLDNTNVKTGMQMEWLTPGSSQSKASFLTARDQALRDGKLGERDLVRCPSFAPTEDSEPLVFKGSAYVTAKRGIINKIQHNPDVTLNPVGTRDIGAATGLNGPAHGLKEN